MSTPVPGQPPEENLADSYATTPGLVLSSLLVVLGLVVLGMWFLLAFGIIQGMAPLGILATFVIGAALFSSGIARLRAVGKRSAE